MHQNPAGGKISSPCNDHDRNGAAHFVFSNGYVFGNWEAVVDDSYGNHFSFSPDLVYYYDYAYCIDKRGAVYDNDQYVAETSYGIFSKKIALTLRTYSVIVVKMDGELHHLVALEV